MTRIVNCPATPELDRMIAVHDKSQAIGEFFDWLNEQGIHLARPHRHDQDVCGKTDGFWDCGFSRDEFEMHNEPVEKLLARFFDIDLDRIEKERRAVLEAVRSADSPRGLESSPSPGGTQ